jgi:hypothetical protein
MDLPSSSGKKAREDTYSVGSGVSTDGEELFCWIRYKELFPACSQMGKNYSVGSSIQSYSQRVHRSVRTILLDPVYRAIPSVFTDGEELFCWIR